jgi:hypothetical protein
MLCKITRVFLNHFMLSASANDVCLHMSFRTTINFTNTRQNSNIFTTFIYNINLEMFFRHGATAISIMTLSIITLSIMTHNKKKCSAECHYFTHCSAFDYAECHFAECRGPVKCYNTIIYKINLRTYRKIIKLEQDLKENRRYKSYFKCLHKNTLSNSIEKIFQK